MAEPGDSAGRPSGGPGTPLGPQVALRVRDVSRPAPDRILPRHAGRGGGTATRAGEPGTRAGEPGTRAGEPGTRAGEPGTRAR